MVHLLFEAGQHFTKSEQLMLSRFSFNCLNESLLRLLRQVLANGLDGKVNSEHVKLSVDFYITTVQRIKPVKNFVSALV